MSAPVDPVQDPGGYQRLLLSLLGGDDPAVAQRSVAEALHRLVDAAGDRLHEQPAAAEWSVQQILAHLVDAEVVMSGRYRWALAQDRPPLIGYDQDHWVDRLHPQDEQAEDLLALFECLRRANLLLWSRTPEAARQRVGIHAERGLESYDLMFRMIGGHDRFHITQMQQTLAAVRVESSHAS